MNVKTYIDSGILETYLLGLATEEEVHELMYLKKRNPGVQDALAQLELEMELIAGEMAVTPPPGTWDKIQQQIEDPTLKPVTHRIKTDYNYDYAPPRPKEQQFIEVEAESSHMRIRKTWKWVFAAVFVLGKIFLGCAIYFYLENRQAQEQIQELKTELRQQGK